MKITFDEDLLAKLRTIHNKNLLDLPNEDQNIMQMAFLNILDQTFDKQLIENFKVLSELKNEAIQLDLSLISIVNEFIEEYKEPKPLFFIYFRNS